ncbi:thiolase family protein [Candidatus Laterigemmans baculatus]|uniref:thiolase family protein n=1 Tax=Candidatus Laterigemmans baculatus TaxID=2770505 RepID=UPI0013D8FCD4|nr:thiolase family protein [Candidatus Laterigemmans baculatus]
MKRVVIVAAKRTPFGRFRGALAGLSAVELAVAASDAMLQAIDRSLIDQVILGNVLSAGQGMNVARQVSVGLGLPLQTPAWSVNMMCGSGMQSALAAVSAIRAGEARVVLAGGTESMSQSPLLVPRPGKGQEPELTAAVDSLHRDGLVDSFSGCPMGVQAEALAKTFQLSRSMQDAFAHRSQQLFAAASRASGFQDELAPVAGLVADEHPRPEATRDDLAALGPVFDPAGTVTAGNASGVNDGAAVALLAEHDFALAQGWPVLAEWVDGIVVGLDPQQMGLGPVEAITALLHRTDRAWPTIDALEINEAFAAQTLACLSQLGFELDLSQPQRRLHLPDGHAVDFNSEGGAIAVGHPLAASGGRVLGHLAWKIARGEGRSAIGALCIGGGMGIACLLTAVDESS